jgi:transposase-like protein
MYGLGMSLRDISKHIKDMYDTEISHSTISAITDKIIPEVKEWQSKPLEELIRLFGLMSCTTNYRMVSHAVYNTEVEIGLLFIAHNFRKWKASLA